MALAADERALKTFSRALSHLPEPGWRTSQSTPITLWQGLLLTEESLWDRFRHVFSFFPRRRSRVFALHLTGHGVEGKLPQDVGKKGRKNRHALSSLKHLVLHGNCIHGHIPPAIGKLVQLRTINLGQSRSYGFHFGRAHREHMTDASLPFCLAYLSAHYPCATPRGHRPTKRKDSSGCCPPKEPGAAGPSRQRPRGGALGSSLCGSAPHPPSSMCDICREPLLRALSWRIPAHEGTS